MLITCIKNYQKQLIKARAGRTVLCVIALLLATSHVTHTNSDNTHTNANVLCSPDTRAKTAKKIASKTLKSAYNLFKFYGIMNEYEQSQKLARLLLESQNQPLMKKADIASYLVLNLGVNFDTSKEYFNNLAGQQAKDCDNSLKSIFFGIAHSIILMKTYIPILLCCFNIKNCEIQGCLANRYHKKGLPPEDKARAIRHFCSISVMLYTHATSAYKHFKHVFDRYSNKRTNTIKPIEGK